MWFPRLYCPLSYVSPVHSFWYQLICALMVLNFFFEFFWNFILQNMLLDYYLGSFETLHDFTVLFFIGSLIMTFLSTWVATITYPFPFIDVTGKAPVWPVYIVSAGSSIFKKISCSLSIGPVSSISSSGCLLYGLGLYFTSRSDSLFDIFHVPLHSLIWFWEVLPYCFGC